MDFDQVTADLRIVEQRSRVARAQWLGTLVPTQGVSSSPRLARFAAALVAGTMVRAIGAAVRRVGGLVHDGRASLRSREHDLAARGIGWTADTVVDRALAEELQAARRRRLAAPATGPVPATPIRPPIGPAAEADKPGSAGGGSAHRRDGRLWRAPCPEPAGTRF